MAPKRILVVDDQPDLIPGLLPEIAENLEAVHPRDLTVDQIEAASVVLVDHHLDAREWPERDSLPLACQPQNGVALAVIVQAHLRSPRFQHNSPTAVALFSARLDEVTPGLVNPPEHIAAQACGLDWAFSKNQTVGRFALRIPELAEAVDRLPRRWQSDDFNGLWSKIAELLGLNALEWEGTALSHVERCHPPIHELAKWTDGVSVVRWIAQRILPYPTFLMDAYQVAMRLGVRPLWMKKEIERGGSVREALEPAVYKGVLKTFLGIRWWVAGLDELLWKALGEGALDSKEVKAWMREFTDSEPEWLADDEVLVLNDDLQYDGSTAPYSASLEIRPDDWPPYASTPWTSKERLSKSHRLHSLVSASDWERFENA
jgi:hypothetical protein